MAKYVVLNHQISRATGELWSVHAAGCRDIEKDKRAHCALETMVEGALDDAMNTALDSETREMGYDESYVKVHGCAARKRQP